MPKRPNPKCLHCSTLSTEQAKLVYGAVGVGCWDEARCHNRRWHYGKRKPQQTAALAAESLEVGIEPPATYYAVLYLYKDKGNCPLHALGAELWHGQEPKLRLKPVHCFGLTQSKIATYAGEVLAAFSQHCDTPLRQFKDQFEVSPERCPIRPCPLFGVSDDG